MRPFYTAFAPALLFGAVLATGAAAQTRAECEYRNPDFPNWNYLRACTVTSVQNGDRTTTSADVDNGSKLTIVEEAANGALRFVVNGRAATRLEDGVSRCYLTTDDEETICIHGANAAAAAPETAAPQPDAQSEDQAIPVGAVGAALGGGEAGHCLSWVTDEDREGLIGQGACVRRTNCAEIEGDEGMSCLIDLVWENGTETVITRRGGVYTLDGAVAVPDERGCLTDEGAGLHFCFSEAQMTAAAFPALELPPAPPPVESVAAAAVPAAAALDEAAPADTGHRCSFLRDDVEVSSWSCTETVTCDAPLCTVSYVFENGTNVTLDTADGQIMLMNGAKADPAAWAEGSVIDVTRPGAPYTFRFTPGPVTAPE